MKILVVAPWIPSVRRPRSLEILRHLQDVHKVYFVGATWNESEDAAFRSLPVTGKWSVRLGRSRAALRALRALFFSSDSLQQAFVSDPRLVRLVRSAVDQVRPDLLLFNVNRSVQLRDIAPEVPAIVDLDEYRSAYFRLLAENSPNLLLRAVSSIEAKRISRSEEHLPASFARILVSSPVDLDKHPQVSLVRSTVDVGSEPIRRTTAARPNIVFSGRQSYRANREAVTWFGEEVFPSVVSSLPDAHLSIVGADPPRRVRSMAGDNVTVTGTVPEVRPYLEAATIAVIPVRNATGVQLKLLEAMAVGLPSVVSPVVARGAGIEDGVHCLVADDADEWISAVIRLLTDVELRERIMKESAAWLRKSHSTEVTRNALLQEVDAALER